MVAAYVVAMHPIRMLSCYRPRGVAKLVFTDMCHSGCTPPDVPLLYAPPDAAWIDGQQAVGTHPTGMHSCLGLLVPANEVAGR